VTLPPADRAAVFIRRDGKILLIYRKKDGRVYDAVPGGKIDPGESPAQAAVREVREETGLTVTLHGPVLTLQNQDRTEYYFDAREVKGEAVLGGDEAKRNSAANRYVLMWIELGALSRRPIFPPALREWMAGRDWSALER
jgi:8-oxo-dGTP pyrophosphatase MutT (NUDIX family)